MKRIAILLIAIIAISACTSNAQDNQVNQEWFFIEIFAQQFFDCRMPGIIFLDRQQEAYQVIGNSFGKYIATGLPKVNSLVGTTMYVSSRRPDVNEILVCANMGPSLAQVHIDSIK